MWMCCLLFSPEKNPVCCFKLPLGTWQHTIILSRTNSFTYAHGNRKLKMRLSVIPLCNWPRPLHSCLKTTKAHSVFTGCTYSIWRAEILSLSTSWALLKSNSMFCVSLLWTALSSASSLSCLFVNSCSWALRREKNGGLSSWEKTDAADLYYTTQKIVTPDWQTWLCNRKA